MWFLWYLLNQDFQIKNRVYTYALTEKYSIATSFAGQVWRYDVGKWSESSRQRCIDFGFMQGSGDKEQK